MKTVKTDRYEVVWPDIGPAGAQFRKGDVVLGSVLGDVKYLLKIGAVKEADPKADLISWKDRQPEDIEAKVAAAVDSAVAAVTADKADVEAELEKAKAELEKAKEALKAKGGAPA